ncbi:F-box family protein [Arabidopsis thaliana]|uniref:Putative F-box protein At3g19560 n=1 Tax=Arabidopsis thaliana TaxID=3702 RepID=FB164_ARATH|nr:F-box family protein [Arabidopsis thaliana]Q9LJP0.2 RecName: Full=Putative F-box protein At3g19560 [Arabidopsis thaliana]AEE76258.1 F-box family protein [Arabidopsis thaliana]|eukprot:NP_188590.2 F-box family protein [Arabidopsis thaliana]
MCMTMMSDISQDLLEEILSRVPITSLRAVKSTCKRWKDLLNDPSFSKKYGGKRDNEFLAIMTSGSRASLMSVNLHGPRDNKDLEDPFIKQIGELNQDQIFKVFHCDGLLLCITNEDNTRLVVWNPYLAQTRCIQPIDKFYIYDWYCLGYDKDKNHKILVVYSPMFGRIEYEIYSFLSKSWIVLSFPTDWQISRDECLSLKGNTYFIAYKKMEVEEVGFQEFLLCFDFTNERFGPLLPLPFQCYNQTSLVLSTVQEEQLAVLCKRCDAYETKIWITTKIEPNAVSWSYFLKFDFKVDISGGSFFVDVEEKVAVLFCINREKEKGINNKTYMIGEDGYYKEVDLGESNWCPSMCSYVPSCVQV